MTLTPKQVDSTADFLSITSNFKRKWMEGIPTTVRDTKTNIVETKRMLTPLMHSNFPGSPESGTP